MNQHLQTILNFIQQAEHLSADEKIALSKAAKDADKDLEITSFKLDRTEKVKRTTAILLEETIEELEQKRKAVEAQNRELEIESSLERVRTVAMSMNKPDDLLRICEILFTELHALGFEELRNAMINIYDDDKVYFLNYDYAPGPGKTVTHIPYNFHPLINKQVNETKNAGDAFIEFSFSGQELRDFRELRKNNGEQDDPKLDDCSSLHYYFYSFGTGSIGISTYKAITDEKKNVLKRFRNVFDLAYKKYIDITNAEAQAREAQVQLALERVRARTMAMQNSDELKDAAALLFQQVKALGVPALSCGYNIWKKGEKECDSWMSTQDGSGINPALKIPLTEDANFIRFNESRKRGEQFYVLEMRGERMQEHYRYLRKTIPVFREYFDNDIEAGLPLPETQIHHIANFSQGNLMFITLEPCPEFHDVFKRFAAVFEQTYARFLDLQKAEAQARESQIQLALERVRARTMAMQKSDELSETVYILFQQFKELGENPDQATIGIINEEEQVIEYWVTMYGNQNNKVYKFSIDEPNVTNKIYKAWKENKSSLVIDLSGDALSEFMSYRAGKGGAAVNPNEKRRIINVAFFSKGLLNVQSNEERSKESIQLLERFAMVFEQTYTRFLDLQKAEAQARESQIQLAMERVRARTMAMQRSDELQDVAILLFQQVKELGIEPWASGFNIWQEGNDSYIDWVSTPAGFLEPYTVDLTSHPVFREISNAKKRGEDFHVFDTSGKALQETYALLISFAPKQFEGILASGIPFPTRQINHYVYGAQVGLMFITPEPVPEAHDIFKRFGKVFEQTYTRFLDLQKAEAQARESQIEASLERVRSRSMGMQKSEELKVVIQIIYEQLTYLNFDIGNIGFLMDYRQSDDYNIWLTDSYTEFPTKIHIPYFDHPLNNDYLEQRDNGPELFTKVYSFEEKNNWFAGVWKTITVVSEESQKAALNFPALAVSRVFLKNIGLYLFNYSGTLYSDAENATLIRFGKVFEQTYTRFLDLQKAEAQAREAQIEAALERVRSLTMAMQKSEDLNKAASDMFKQIQVLGMQPWGCGFNIFDKDEKAVTQYMSLADGGISPPFRTPLTEDPFFINIYDARQRGDELLVMESGGESLAETYHYMFSLPGSGEIFGDLENSGFEMPKFQITHCAYFSQGYLVFITYEPVPEAHDIFKRFAKVFEQTYTRFLDLQKAEAQVRESQIQLALERVRARTMAMQKSEELQEVVHTMLERLKDLNVEFYTAIIILFAEDLKDIIWWLENKEKQQYSRVLVPYANIAYLRDLFEARENGRNHFSKTYPFEEKNELFHHLFSATDFQYVPDKQRKFLLESEAATMSVAIAKNTGIHLTRYSDKIFSEEDNEILKRFAKVFEQSYTRFLDLQKAEAQAREAQIENALEKVRSRTMAMQKSEELPEAANVLFLQVQSLGIPAWSCGYNILAPDKKSSTCIMSSEGEIQVPFVLPLTEHSSLLPWYEAIQSNLDFFVYGQGGKDLIEHYRYLATVPGLEKVFQQFDDAGISLPANQINHLVRFTNGFLLFITYESVPQAHDIFKRFGKVFEQTYTRFLDLQKAEAQAREAKIEAALERVRSRTMAMQRSDELAEASFLLDSQVRALGIKTRGCAFNIYGENESTEWFSSEMGTMPVYKTPRENVFLTYYEEGKKGKQMYIKSYTGDACAAHYDYLCTLPVMGEALKKVKESGGSFPDQQIDHVTYFKYGYLLFITLEPVPEAHDIFKRFAKVFEQTYTRFLDLQKAEAQAREAQIEAALERVRSRTMGMQRSDELQGAALLLFQQAEALGVKAFACGFNIWDDDRKFATAWMGSVQGLQNPFKTDSSKDIYLPIYEAAQRGEAFFVREQGGEELKVHYDYLATIPIFRDIFMVNLAKAGFAIPSFQIIHCAFFAQGYLMFISYEPCPEAYDIFKRFAKVFEQTYTRFLDLQKAEAQAKEATKQASLDRVRGQIASMRSTEDLQRITPLIWHELTSLDVPFIRCGVLIIDEAKAEANIYLSSPDGHSLAAMNLPLQSNTLTANSVAYWRKGLVYTEHWSKEDFVNWMQSMIEQGQVQNPETYQGAATPPESLQLHFVPFTQGMLYVGNTDLLSDDEIDLVKSLAEAFSIAYARYEDFTKLEKAKQSIEVTLTELKATQTQLVQSEKMASLGELTAGIAHEIQNPLNFVNNFSEVNKELLAEMTEEIDKGNFEEAKSLAKDVADNEEKINHHGKRADAIVKGMLQHSRSSTGVKEPTNINALADEYLRLAYHGLRAKDKSFNATMKTDFDKTIGTINIIPQDIGRVILNLITNAFYVVDEKKKQIGDGYEPTVSVSTKKGGDKIFVSVKDNGNGIPQKVVDKIFQPFFTTKPTGQGTGLGLSLSYDIVKAHGGEIKIETKEGDGSEFIIQIPI